MAPLVCLLTPGHLASTPRLVKEADTLHHAGYRVHVVAGRHFAPVDPLDTGVLAGAQWSCTRIELHRGPGAAARRLLGRAARLWFRRGAPASWQFAARAVHPECFRLGAAAARVGADFYLGHCLAGLPAAAFAARRAGAVFGFDLEDFHEAETDQAPADSWLQRAARRLQGTLLPGCRHLTAASPFIAQAVAEAYGVAAGVVLNVFPRAQAPAGPAPVQPISAARPARFYWFSQTIGPGRGLEAVLAIVARMRTPVELRLRGFVTAAYRETLQRRARDLGASCTIEFLAPGPAGEMARLAADSDLGLSTEERQPRNRDLCLTNKIFVYLLAGLPQLLSETAAQTALAPELGAAALIGELRDPATMARRLDEFFADIARASAARRTAWDLGQRRFCWDEEQRKFVDSVRHVV